MNIDMRVPLPLHAEWIAVLFRTLPQNEPRSHHAVQFLIGLLLRTDLCDYRWPQQSFVSTPRTAPAKAVLNHESVTGRSQIYQKLHVDVEKPIEPAPETPHTL